MERFIYIYIKKVAGPRDRWEEVDGEGEGWVGQGRCGCRGGEASNKPQIPIYIYMYIRIHREGDGWWWWSSGERYIATKPN